MNSFQKKLIIFLFFLSLAIGGGVWYGIHLMNKKGNTEEETNNNKKNGILVLGLSLLPIWFPILGSAWILLIAYGTKNL